jgi:putative transposase
MTGYAVTFNKRHKRAGHLFQNRYKSVICEEDPYLLELIRYIHLNPLRAKLVQDLNELDKYPWSGHSAILGYCKNPLLPEIGDQKAEVSKQAPSPSGPPNQPPTSNLQLPTKTPLAEKTIEDVLLHFGETQKIARRRYRDFVEKGIAQGRRPEFQGGGLVRSAGGDKAGLLGRAREEREKGDARILGSGDFVSETLQQAGEEWEKSYGAKMPLEELIKTVASHFEIEERDLKSPSKKKQVVEAKSAFGYLAIKKMGYSGREVGSFLNMRSYSAIRRAQEGKKLIDNRGDMSEISVPHYTENSGIVATSPIKG